MPPSEAEPLAGLRRSLARYAVRTSSLPWSLRVRSRAWPPSAEYSRDRVYGHAGCPQAHGALHGSRDGRIRCASMSVCKPGRAVLASIGVPFGPIPTRIPGGSLHARTIRIRARMLRRPRRIRPFYPGRLPDGDQQVGMCVRRSAAQPSHPPVRRIVCGGSHRSIDAATRAEQSSLPMVRGATSQIKVSGDGVKIIRRHPVCWEFSGRRRAHAQPRRSSAASGGVVGQVANT
jgi:hypothetical protein